MQNNEIALHKKTFQSYPPYCEAPNPLFHLSLFYFFVGAKVSSVLSWQILTSVRGEVMDVTTTAVMFLVLIFVHADEDFASVMISRLA